MSKLNSISRCSCFNIRNSPIIEEGKASSRPDSSSIKVKFEKIEKLPLQRKILLLTGVVCTIALAGYLGYRYFSFLEPSNNLSKEGLVQKDENEIISALEKKVEYSNEKSVNSTNIINYSLSIISILFFTFFPCILGYVNLRGKQNSTKITQQGEGKAPNNIRKAHPRRKAKKNEGSISTQPYIKRKKNSVSQEQLQKIHQVVGQLYGKSLDKKINKKEVFSLEFDKEAKKLLQKNDLNVNVYEEDLKPSITKITKEYDEYEKKFLENKNSNTQLQEGRESLTDQFRPFLDEKLSPPKKRIPDPYIRLDDSFGSQKKKIENENTQTYELLKKDLSKEYNDFTGFLKERKK